MSLQKIESSFAKPAIAGILGRAYSWYASPGTGSIFRGSSPVPSWAVVGLTVAASSFAGEIAGNYILPRVLPMAGGQLTGLATVALNPALAAGATVFGTQFFAPDQYTAMGAGTLAVVGAGSYIAADYLAKNVFHLTY
jgi:hypothetical protein